MFRTMVLSIQNNLYLGGPFYYRGCGWRPKKMGWTSTDKLWIESINNLFNELFGPDYCQYMFNERKHCVLVPGQFPTILYDRDEWEMNHLVVPEKAKIDKPDNNIKQSTDVHVGHHKDENTTGNVNTNANSFQVSSTDLSRMTNLSRSEIAATNLPKVVFIPEKDVLLVEMTEGTDISNPLLTSQRPSEAIVLHALSLLQSTAANSSTKGDASDEETDQVAVKIGGLGTYTRESLQVFQSMCRLSSVVARVHEEKRWLSQMPFPDVTKVSEMLLNSRPTDEILRHGNFIMDVSDFSTLACERYVNGFTIDVSCLKLLERTLPAFL